MSRTNSNKKIVTIGGGSGQYALLSGLRDIPDIDITAIVSMVDSGGSTGRLRDELGILPPGDILKCVLALAKSPEMTREILQKRFKGEGKLSGHSVGNMLLAMISQYSMDFPESVRALCDILDCCGKVFPVTTDKATLVAELTDGRRLYGEEAIDVPAGKVRGRIKSTFLVPHSSDMIKVYPPVIEAIKKADYIVVGPGDLYTSITPNFLVEGVVDAIRQTKGLIIYAVNIMTKYGETDDYTARDFTRELERFIKREVDAVIINSARPDDKVLKEYAKQKAKLVETGDRDSWGKRLVVKRNFLNTKGDIARHDPKKLARTINKIIA